MSDTELLRFVVGNRTSRKQVDERTRELRELNGSIENISACIRRDAFS
jgi:hypothetical protein